MSLSKKYLIALIAVVLFGASHWPTDVTTVILVRHAEKSTEPPDDPYLTDAGIQRTQTLVHTLSDIDVEVIISSQFHRTKDTIAPLAERFGLEPVIIPAGESAALIDAIKSTYRGKTIVISGHSNTTPNTMRLLGVESVDDIDESQYSNLFIVRLETGLFSSSAEMTNLNFGAPTGQ